jgi:chaperonin GroES
MKLVKNIKITKDVINSPNLMDRLDRADIDAIGLLCYEGYKRDKMSRLVWERRMEAGMDLAMQVSRDKNFPWTGCSNVIFPLITIAALQFSARAYSNIISGTDVVKYRVVGDDPTGEVRNRADRISKHMSWQILEEDTSWEEQHDRLLINLGIVGTNFIKTYFSPRLNHNVSELVLARDFVLDYYAKSVESCARKTQIVPLYRNEIYERCQSEIFDPAILDAEWYHGVPTKPTSNPKVDNRHGQQPPQPDEDTPFITLEQHRLLDLDGDGYAEPYIVTIEESSKAVLRIVARYDSEDAIERTSSGRILRIHPTEYYTKYSFIPAPDGSVYDVGFGVLLGPLNEAVNTGINQLLDSGTMQNSIGGFLGRGAKIRGGVYTMAPWEWKRVDSTGDDLRKNMVPFPERQPSTVMFQLLNLLINYTDRVAGTVDQMVGENPGQNTPAETSRNMTEQGMQVYSVIFKRVWRSMKEEFKKLHYLNSLFLPSRQRYGTMGEEIRQEDYKSSSEYVVPVADPHIVSQSQRVAQASAVRAAAHQVPGYDIPLVEKNYLRALKVEGIDELYKGPNKVPPLPNPKMQVEQGKIQIKQMDIEYKKQALQAKLMEDRRVNTARIAQMEAQAMKLMHDAGIDRDNTQLKAFDMAIKAMQEHNNMLNERIKSLGDSDEGKTPDGGGVPGMAQPSGDTGVQQVPPGIPGGDQGAMG